MREKLLEALGLIAPTVQRQTHNMLGSISATENSTYLPIIIDLTIVTISKGYFDIQLFKGRLHLERPTRQATINSKEKDRNSFQLGC
jgi:hypothetical protein